MRPSTRLEIGQHDMRALVAMPSRHCEAVSAKAMKTGTAGLSHPAAIHSAFHVLAPARAETASLQGEALACRVKRSTPSMIQAQFVHHGV